jgi:hypothetical protein
MSMAHEPGTSSGDPGPVSIVVHGLRKSSRPDKQNDDETHIEETLTERVTLPESVPISALWAELKCECDSGLCINPGF